MQASLRWIQRYAPIPDVSPKDLLQAVTLSTVEVEEAVDRAALLEGVVVGKVVELVKHPKADRLWVCRVDVKTEVLQIICGGTNVRDDMLVAVAKIGSHVRWHGEGERITLSAAKIRGIESSGMIAASNELGLEKLFPAASDHEILDLTNLGVRVGQPLSEALGIDDIILDIDNKSMTHRPDLWGQYGMARELAAIYGVSLKKLAIPKIPDPTNPAKPFSIEVLDPKRCPRFCGIVIDGITPKESPWWLKRDLESVGINPINSIVDVTNYVMMAISQPMHAYDYEKLSGNLLRAGVATAKTSMRALNEESYTLDSETLVIQDGKGAVGIAGIIGGAGTKVTASTKTIALEAASFSADTVRKTSMRLGVRTDASARFEKSLDPTLPPQAIALAVELLMDIHPEARVASRMIDVQSIDASDVSITVPHELLLARLGITIDPKHVTAMLKKLEFGATFKKGIHTVAVPSFRRRDMRIPEDVIEEVARSYGYQKIEPVLPDVRLSEPPRNPAARIEREVKQLLARAFGYSEALHYSFADPEWTERLGLSSGRVSVSNALTPDMKYLRTSHIPQLAASLERNFRRTGDIRLFELGRVFSKRQGEFPVGGGSDQFLPRQPLILAGIVGSTTESEEALYRQAKGMLTQLAERFSINISFRPTASLPNARLALELRIHDKTLGYLGLFKSDIVEEHFGGNAVVWWEVSYEQLVKYASFGRVYQPLPKYPSIVRDIAIVVDNSVTWERVQALTANASILLFSVEVFDVFTSPKLGEHKKSIAFRLTFQSDERTLESGEVDAVIARLSKKLTSELGALVR